MVEVDDRPSKLAETLKKKTVGVTKSTHECAGVVTKAIEEALGISFTRPEKKSAKYYGAGLIAAGFEEGASPPYQPGDVRIYQEWTNNGHGHMQMYVGDGQWTSDFIQPNEHPNQAAAKVSYKTYRLKKK